MPPFFWQRVSKSAGQRVSELASQQVSKSASQRVSGSASQRVSELARVVGGWALCSPIRPTQIRRAEDAGMGYGMGWRGGLADALQIARKISANRDTPQIVRRRSELWLR